MTYIDFLDIIYEGFKLISHFRDVSYKFGIRIFYRRICIITYIVIQIFLLSSTWSMNG